MDTECSILRQREPHPKRVVDELIFGDFGSGEAYGIGLHMDLLERHGFRGVFFIDVLIEYEYGQKALERTVEAIAARGHELQLHAHPWRLRFARDPKIASLASALSSPEQDDFRRMMELSVDLFERRTGQQPLAYRAGGYRIADMHFPVLEELGIRIDSSVNTLARSGVADWMRVRTQPFWVGNVLEIPPTLLLHEDGAGSWQTRGFFPNPSLVDPLGAMAGRPGGAPEVATYVSHSFQLLHTRRETGAAAVAALNDRVRAAVPPDVADRFAQPRAKEVVTYGEEPDRERIAAVAALLQSAADRPGARCATYAELDAAIDRLWATEKHPPTDPIPLIGRRDEPPRATATRVLGAELLSHLASAPQEHEEDLAEASGGEGALDGLESRTVVELLEALTRAVGSVEPGQTARARFRTLGIAAPDRRGPLPPLAELLFPSEAVRAALRQLGIAPNPVLAWDAATFVAWLVDQGFDVVRSRRLPRAEHDLSAAGRFEEKLRWIDRSELETASVEVELGPTGPRPRRATERQPIATRPGLDEFAVALPANCSPERLPATANELYASLEPGHRLAVRIPVAPAPASRTTVLLSLMRAGLEVVDAEVDDGSVEHHLIRPVELADIRRFASPPKLGPAAPG